MRYPFNVTADGDGLLITFPDIPEAITAAEGDEDVTSQANAAMVSALATYAALGRPFPKPSAHGGRRTAQATALDVAKLGLISAMAERGMTNVALAAKLGIDERAVRRLVDLDHNSRLDKIEAALAALGKRLDVAVRAA